MLIRTALSATLMIATLAHAEPPKTAKKPVTDEYHGVKVTEDYRWLEDWNSKDVQAWSEAQNAATRKALDGLSGADKIRKRVTELLSAESPNYLSVSFHGGLLFALKQQPPKQQALLVVMRSPDEPEQERILVDPNKLDSTGGTTIDWFVPNADGSMVAVSMSKGGSESGDVTVYETDTGNKLDDMIPRVHGGTAGGSLTWDEGGSGFYYTRYPRGSERPAADMDFYQQVYHHLLGTPTENDAYEAGKDFPRIAEVQLQTTDDGKFVLATVANGDGGEFAHYLRIPDNVLSPDRGSWKKVTRFSDRVTYMGLRNSGPFITLTSLQGAPKGKIGLIPLFNADLGMADWVIPEQEFVIDGFARTGQAYVWVFGHNGGPSEAQIFEARGNVEGFINLPPVSTIEAVEPFGDSEVLMLIQSYTEPPAWYRVKISDETPRKTKLAKQSAADYSDCEVVREVAISKDGTKVPLSILRKKGTKLDGSNPTLITGYGGYGISGQPGFSEGMRIWLEQGGVFAEANIRGGGEFGDEWHKGGNLLNKQNVFDDFAACMQRLIELKYTTPEKLAITGGSNGGLLMGAMITQHPDLFRAVVSHVGIYDMLRVELSPNGAFNVTEFGTVKDREQFKAMYAYSPYHHVKDGTKYPSILMMTGANDPRVDPMQSRKMIARLQAATGSKNPVLLRTSANAGHGVGSSLSQRIERYTDQFAFLMHEMGMEYKAAK